MALLASDVTVIFNGVPLKLRLQEEPTGPRDVDRAQGALTFTMTLRVSRRARRRLRAAMLRAAMR